MSLKAFSLRHYFPLRSFTTHTTQCYAAEYYQTPISSQKVIDIHILSTATFLPMPFYFPYLKKQTNIPEAATVRLTAYGLGVPVTAE